MIGNKGRNGMIIILQERERRREKRKKRKLKNSLTTLPRKPRESFRRQVQKGRWRRLGACDSKPSSTWWRIQGKPHGWDQMTGFDRSAGFWSSFCFCFWRPFCLFVCLSVLSFRFYLLDIWSPVVVWRRLGANLSVKDGLLQNPDSDTHWLCRLKNMPKLFAAPENNHSDTTPRPMRVL